MEKSGINKYLIPVLMSVILIVSFFYLLRPVSDPDFFWHLKTGEWIWQNKELPSKDPFSYTTSPLPAIRKNFILTSYWLSQVAYHLFYLIGGMAGIIFLRFIIVAALFYIMIKRHPGDDILYMGLLIIFLISLLEGCPVERPQVFSFLFFAILLHLLEKQVKNEAGVERKPNLNFNLFLLPFLMLIWANSHGGYFLGQVTITLYILTEGIKFIHRSLNPIKKEAYKRLLIAGFSGIAFSLINPNTYHALEILSIPTYALFTNIEYQSTLDFFRNFNDYSIILYWFIALLTIIGLIINLKKIDITKILLLAGTGYFSFMHVRYVPFFLIAALPVIVRCFSTDRLVKWIKVFVIPMALVVAMFFTWDEFLNIRNIRSGKWIDEYRYPVKAAEFVIANDLRGNMYNHYNWGGYLIWRLAPERKVFIDGRFLNENIYWQSLTINIAYEGTGIPRWKSLLESYGVRYVIIPVSEPGVPLIPLVNALLKDKDWVLVFYYFNSMVFVKDSPENYNVIRRYSIPKNLISMTSDLCNKLINSRV